MDGLVESLLKKGLRGSEPQERTGRIKLVLKGDLTSQKESNQDKEERYGMITLFFFS